MADAVDEIYEVTQRGSGLPRMRCSKGAPLHPAGQIFDSVQYRCSQCAAIVMKSRMELDVYYGPGQVVVVDCQRDGDG